MGSGVRVWAGRDSSLRVSLRSTRSAWVPSSVRSSSRRSSLPPLWTLDRHAALDAMSPALAERRLSAVSTAQTVGVVPPAGAGAVRRVLRALVLDGPDPTDDPLRLGIADCDHASAPIRAFSPSRIVFVLSAAQFPLLSPPPIAAQNICAHLGPVVTFCDPTGVPLSIPLSSPAQNLNPFDPLPQAGNLAVRHDAKPSPALPS